MLTLAHTHMHATVASSVCNVQYFIDGHFNCNGVHSHAHKHTHTQRDTGKQWEFLSTLSPRVIFILSTHAIAASIAVSMQRLHHCCFVVVVAVALLQFHIYTHMCAMYSYYNSNLPLNKSIKLLLCCCCMPLTTSRHTQTDRHTFCAHSKNICNNLLFFFYKLCVCDDVLITGKILKECCMLQVVCNSKFLRFAF